MTTPSDKLVDDLADALNGAWPFSFFDGFQHTVARMVVVELFGERLTALDELLARCKAVEEPDGTWPGSDIVDVVTSLLTKHGYDVEAELDVKRIQVCDGCFELMTGAVAECQDHCSLALDHDGLCAARAKPGADTACQRCGDMSRLHRVEAGPECVVCHQAAGPNYHLPASSFAGGVGEAICDGCWDERLRRRSSAP